MNAAPTREYNHHNMNRTLCALTIISLLLLSCGTGDTSLWGQYSTPTPLQPVSVTTSATSANPTLEFPLIETQTPLPIPSSTFTLTPTFIPLQGGGENPSPTSSVQPILYYAQSGDTIPTVATRFGVERSEIASPKNLPPVGFIEPGTLLIIQKKLDLQTGPSQQILPDAEFVFSATSADFDINTFILGASGYLSTYREYLSSTAWTTGPQEIERLAFENSINPRLLLAMLEYESHWVYGATPDTLHEQYPMAYETLRFKGLFSQMVWTVNHLHVGYYGWRSGKLTTLTFPNGETLRLDPALNAGSAAVQYFFSLRHNRAEWEQIITPGGANSFEALYTKMFGDGFARANAVEPLITGGLSQPKLVLPFQINFEWSLTGGPHGAWGKITEEVYGQPETVLAAVDFAPSSEHGGCEETKTWILSAGPGTVVRSSHGVVVVDMDGDGLEQTGWNIVYLHVATADRIAKSTLVKTDDRIGHASCEGGSSTGTHLHFSRKYNGEWMLADGDGPAPMVLSNWTVHTGTKSYEGTMTRGARTVIADPVGQSWSVIIRLREDE